jgi:aspartate/glutamate racemase
MNRGFLAITYDEDWQFWGEQSEVVSIILGCTELPLILDGESYEGILFLNTTRIHAQALVRCCLDTAR